MNGWKEGCLSDVAIIEMGQSPNGDTTNLEGNGHPLLNGPTEFTIKYPIAKQFTIDGKRFSKNNDILFCVRGSTTGRMNWSDQSYAIGRGLASLRHKAGDEYRYYLKGVMDYYLPTLLSEATGSTFPNVSKDQLHNLEISLPPLPEQKAIADVLSTLDDKIDLLQRQNETLEKMAETLFRQWFIEDSNSTDFITLGDMIEIHDSKRIPLSKMEREQKKQGSILYPYYGAANIMDYIDEYLFDGNYLLIGEDGTVQDVNGHPILQRTSGKFWVNNHAHIVSAIEPYSNFFIWCLLSTTNVEKIITGAVQPKINQSNLKSLEFNNFDLDKVQRFVKLTTAMEEKIVTNDAHMQTLQNIRDTLLPKLMSGEVRVKLD